MVTRGNPEYIRSDDGTEVRAERLMKWFADIGVTTI
jgi:hypothetical protein